MGRDSSSENDLIIYGFAGTGGGPLVLSRYDEGDDVDLVANIGIDEHGMYLNREQARQLAGRLLEWCEKP